MAGCPDLYRLLTASQFKETLRYRRADTSTCSACWACQRRCEELGNSPPGGAGLSAEAADTPRGKIGSRIVPWGPATDWSAPLGWALFERSAPLPSSSLHLATPGAGAAAGRFDPELEGPPRRPPPWSPGRLAAPGPQSRGLACAACAAPTRRPRPPCSAGQGQRPSSSAACRLWLPCCRRGGAGRGWASPPRNSSAPSWTGRSSATPCRPWRGNAAPGAPRDPGLRLPALRPGRPATPAPVAALARAPSLGGLGADFTRSVTGAGAPFPPVLQRWAALAL